jgi:large subunit ribosomal protein L30
VSDKTHKTIRIKWVRSGIGFTYHQKTIVRSLGLKRLNQIVVRPDTPQVRGIVAAVPHLLVIVPETPAPAWASVPEYTVHPPEVVVAAPSEPAAEAAGAKATSEMGTVETMATAEAVEAAMGQEEPPPAELAKPAKSARKKAEKPPAKAAAKKAKAALAEEAKPKAAKKKEPPKKESKTAKASRK